MSNINLNHICPTFHLLSVVIKIFAAGQAISLQVEADKSLQETGAVVSRDSLEVTTSSCRPSDQQCSVPVINDTGSSIRKDNLPILQMYPFNSFLTLSYVVV